MSVLGLAATCAALLLAGATLTWLLSLALRDAGVADVAWGLGFVAVTWCARALSDAPWTPVGVLSLGLVTCWGLRLALHVFLRGRGQGEDRRYARWREEAGRSWWWRSYFTVFLLQAALLAVIAMPPVLAQVRAEVVRPSLAVVGASLWLVGFAWEAVADYQLLRFKADPDNAGRLLTSGLWRYSRHPNYFGEAVLWWGLWLVAGSLGAGPAVVAVASPLLLTFLLLRVSGVPLLERELKERKPGHAEYVRRTNTFLPGPPRD